MYCSCEIDGGGAPDLCAGYGDRSEGFLPFTTAMVELPSPHSSVEDLMSLVTISVVCRILKD